MRIAISGSSAGLDPAGEVDGRAAANHAVAGQVADDRPVEAETPLDLGCVHPDLPGARLGAGLDIGRAPRQQRFHSRLDAHRRIVGR